MEADLRLFLTNAGYRGFRVGLRNVGLLALLPPDVAEQEGGDGFLPGTALMDADDHAVGDMSDLVRHTADQQAL